MENFDGLGFIRLILIRKKEKCLHTEKWERVREKEKEAGREERRDREKGKERGREYWIGMEHSH